MSRRSPFFRCCIVLLGAGILIVVFLTVIADLLQTNPPVVSQPQWDSQQTLALAKRACFDCHSNETIYPWYDKLPVSSWLTTQDVLRGRRTLNFSNWQGFRGGGEGEEGGGRNENEIGRVIERGSMPPWYYVVLHPTAALNDQEKQQLITGLQNSLK